MRAAALAILLLILGCRGAEKPVPTITLATTTSTRESGLLDVLLPIFEQTGAEVKVVAVGSGQALEMGRRGDADVLLTHAPGAEAQFVAEGYARERRPVMYNDFVLVGPETDPAGVRNEKSISATSAQIADGTFSFVSRGDSSGTHIKENEVWEELGIAPRGDWYIQAGSGMAQTLRMASEKRAYTLTDRGTFLSQREGLDLVILSQGDPLLRNQYAVIVVNPKKRPHANSDAAKQFAEFLIGPVAQKAIAEYGVNTFGEPLFFPQRGPE